MCATRAPAVQARGSLKALPNGVKIGLNCARLPAARSFGTKRSCPAAGSHLRSRGRLQRAPGGGDCGPTGQATICVDVSLKAKRATATFFHRVPTMTDENPNDARKNAARRDDARQDRLKQKLRENLKRRKSQVRERDRTAVVSSDGHQASPDGEVGKTGA